ncbi:hypothetical protein [Burkholderia sp. Cy-637]|uniref:hypothetical protein n=1 Tax=Burkholderia sp. Cy-637 TaxID=2608327 RepID=UPI00142256EF|nr:hypothetical protein [Burkholderia sp. Cy-637]NIF88864.1 hypothetical protein [Burkholderia sp. Cy-637]
MKTAKGIVTRISGSNLFSKFARFAQVAGRTLALIKGGMFERVTCAEVMRVIIEWPRFIRMAKVQGII